MLSTVTTSGVNDDVWLYLIYQFRYIAQVMVEPVNLWYAIGLSQTSSGRPLPNQCMQLPIRLLFGKARQQLGT